MKPYVYVQCPVCSTRIVEPIYRHCGVDVRIHQPRGCRIAVLPDTRGHRHRVWPLPGGMSMEDGIVWALGRMERAA